MPGRGRWVLSLSSWVDSPGWCQLPRHLGPWALVQRLWKWGWRAGFKEEVADSPCSTEFKIRMFPGRNNRRW